MSAKSERKNSKNQDSSGSAAAKPPLIVGVGASAGGLAALKTFFQHVPADSGLIFVVVVHLSPDHKSHLAELLQPHVKMPVRQVEGEIAMERDNVYIIPPGRNLSSVDTHLRLSNLEKRGPARAPIDHFFRTLADTHDGRSMGIILTGTGSDGTLGIKEIKGKGGIVIVQDPADAEYDGMPLSAVATGLPDIILPLAKIPAAVLRAANVDPKLEVPGDGNAEDETLLMLQRIFAHVRARTGNDFSRYKNSTMLRRIARRMQINSIENVGDYYEHLRGSADEARALASDLLVTVTSFFRDAAVFEKLEKDIVPRLFAEKEPGDDIRAWSVGCATGEEAYSLAILLLDEAERRNLVNPAIQVFATDLHEASLQVARDGFYVGDIETDVTEPRLRRYFIRENGGYRVRKEVRDLVVFAQHNLLSDPPFSHLDLVFCRNLLIYLQRDIQKDVIELLHFALRPSGQLILGTSELADSAHFFTTESKEHCIYRKRNVPSAEPRLPVFPAMRARQFGETRSPAPKPLPDPYGAVHLKMIERHAPPSMLVDADDRIVHLSERAGRYLVHPSGELTVHVLKLVHQNLGIELRSVLHEAREKREPVRSAPIVTQIEGQRRRILLEVHPALDQASEGFCLVVFDDQDPTAPEAAGEAPSPDARNETLIQRLTTDADSAKQRLRSVVEEYETSREEMKASNEELQSANEELRSTLEELETSKEELQSMNEELQTVNQENRNRVEELAQLTADLQNLLAASDIATLFLDRSFRILRFTPKVADLFNVRNTDRGRPLSDLTHRLGYDELQEDARAVLERLVPIEREVKDASGSWYLTRVLPYRSSQDHIEGVVITFVDITQRRKTEEARERSEKQLQAELATLKGLQELIGRLLTSPDLATALDGVLTAVMKVSGSRMGNIQIYDESKKALVLVAHRGFDEQFLKDFEHVTAESNSACGRALKTGRRVVIEDVRQDAAFAPHVEAAERAGYRAVQSTPLCSQMGDVVGVLSTHYEAPTRFSENDLRALDLYGHHAAEFIEHVRASDDARHLERRKDEFIATLSHELRNPLAAIRNVMELAKRRNFADPEVLRLHEIIERQSGILLRLVDDLLQISRITQGKFTLQSTAVEISTIVNHALEESSSEAEAKEHRLVVAPMPGALWVNGDAVRLTQVFVNILTNARRYSPRGGTISITVASKHGNAVVSVRDSGIGIAQDQLQSIFDLFFQAPVERGIHAGLGIGLHLVKLLVGLHGGTVEARSTGLGHGAEFVVTLPLREAPPVAAPARPVRTIRTNAPRILLVDDEPDFLESSSMLLRLQGYEIHTADSGARALEAAKSLRPDVILLDIGLGDMSGYEVAQRIRSQAWGKQIVIVAQTGRNRDQDSKAAEAAKIDHHLTKPVDPDELRGLLSSIERRTDAPR